MATWSWAWLPEHLRGGKDCPKDVEAFLSAGGRPDELLPATVGNREQGVSPCFRSLDVLLQARGDPNCIDKRFGSPLLHVACWGGTKEVVVRLLEHRADIEILEEDVETPPLNSALAAGNAPVALELLRRRASAQWRHKDNATALHVVTAWACDGSRMSRRRPPLGDEPRELVAALLHGGADPALRVKEPAGEGPTPLQAFRSSMAESPWLRDETIGEEFRRTCDGIHRLLSSADVAMGRKAEGNKDHAAGRFQAALQAYAEARTALDKEGITGHHMAVLWSNEAMCCKKMGDLERCRRACEAGLQCWCSGAVRAKLEYNLADCCSPKAQPSDSPGGKDEPTSQESVAPPSVKKPMPAAKGSALKGGFLNGIGDGAKPMYGPAGSAQGKNHSELVSVPVFGTKQKVPFGKVRPVEVPNPNLESRDDSD